MGKKTRKRKREPKRQMLNKGRLKPMPLAQLEVKGVLQKVL